MPKVLAVMQVIEKLPIEATNATRLSNPIVFLSYRRDHGFRFYDNAGTLASRRLAMMPCDGSPPEKPHVPMSALPPKGDIAKHYLDVRVVPKADIEPN
jgi:hypothetical protein